MKGAGNPSMIMVYICVGLKQGKGEKEVWGQNLYTSIRFPSAFFFIV